MFDYKIIFKINIFFEDFILKIKIYLNYLNLILNFILKNKTI